MSDMQTLATVKAEEQIADLRAKIAGMQSGSKPESVIASAETPPFQNEPPVPPLQTVPEVQPYTPEPTKEPEVPATQTQNSDELARLKSELEAERHRFASMKGRFDALSRQYQETNDKVKALTAQIEQINLEKQQQQLQQPAQTVEDIKQRYGLTDEEIADSPEIALLFDRMLGKRLGDTLYPALQSVRQSVKEEVSGMLAPVSQTQQASFFEILDTKVPDWETIQATPQFGEWLNTRDPLTGVLRKDSLESATNSLNAASVIAHFNEFGKATGKAPVNGAAQPTNGTTPKKPSIESQVMPSSAPVAPQAQPVKQREYQADEAYDLRLKITTNHVTAADLQKYGAKSVQELASEIDRAFAEGRVKLPAAFRR